MFVSLRWLSPADGDTTGTSLDHGDKQRGACKLKPSYSQVTASGDGGPSQSSGRPLYSKAANTDTSPSATSCSGGNQPHMKSASRDTAASSSKGAPSKSDLSKFSYVAPSRERFDMGQRVMFCDTCGYKHYGSVGWTSTSSDVVGIITVSYCYSVQVQLAMQPLFCA